MATPHKPTTATIAIPILPFFLAFIGAITFGIGAGLALHSMVLGLLMALGMVLMICSASVIIVKIVVGLIGKIINSQYD